MKSLILLRGLPGAGKSTLANVLAENRYPVFSVDDYFTDSETGVYQFEFDKNYLAYKQCEEHVKKAMEVNTTKIFVANTFTLEWELTPYIKLAAQYNYQLHVVTVEKYHTNSNIHEVSEEQIQKMATKYMVKLH
jgi:predicted kinase